MEGLQRAAFPKETTMTKIHRTARLVRVGPAHRLTQGSILGRPEDFLPGRQVPA